jgi:hypothetical protein
MKWFRSNIQHGSRLALVALAIQFALSFGHFHSLAAQAAPVIQTGTAQSGISYAGILAAPGVIGKSIPQPASDHDSDQSNDGCAICAVIALANAAMFAAPPVLLLPQATEFQYQPTDGTLLRLGSGRVAFQPRAPPLS